MSPASHANTIIFGDCRSTLKRWADDGVRAQMCVTSPPYFGLRDYGHSGQIGLESTPMEYIDTMVDVFRCVREVLADDGTLWLNMGDSYGGGGGNPQHLAQWAEKIGDPRKGGKKVSAGHDVKRAPRPTGLKPKNLLGIPWRVALALQNDGWILRQDIIWAKGTSGLRREGNVMPESVRDRCTKAHEYLFLLSKKPSYYFDANAIKEPAKDWGTRDRATFRGGTNDPKLKHHGLSDCSHEMGNRRSVWRVNPTPYNGAHFATFPPALIEPCILAGSREGDIVLDPFMGSGTTAEVAIKHRRQYLGCELNRDYEALQTERIDGARAELRTSSAQIAFSL